MHYILLREFLRPWALKFGAQSPHWQKDVFDDLVGSDAKQLHYNLVKEDEIEVVGRRFWVRAVEDERRDDTLFVVEIGPSGKKDPRNLIETTWALLKGDRWEPKGSPIRLDSLRSATSAGTFGTTGRLVGNIASTVPGRTSEAALKDIVATWSADWLKEVPPLGPLRPDEALSRLRQRFEQHPDLFGHLASNVREGQVLNNKVSRPVDAARIATSLISRVGISWLETVHRSMPTRLPEAVWAILGLPPPEEVLRWLLRLWLLAASASDFTGYLASTVAWLNAAHESVNRDRWVQFLKEIYAHRVKTRGILANGGPNLGSALSSWKALQLWMQGQQQALAAPAATLPSTPAEGKDAVEPVTKIEGIDSVAPRLVVSSEPRPPPPVEPTPAEQREELMRRLAALRYQGVLAARPNLFGAADKISQQAKELVTILHGLPHGEAIRKAREVLDGISHAASEAKSKLPGDEEVPTAARELDEVTQALMKLLPAGLVPWPDLTSWSDVQQFIRVLGSPSLNRVPVWLYQELAPDEADPAQARIRAASGSARAALRAVLDWIEELPALDADLLAQTARADGADPLSRLKRALETTKSDQMIRSRLTPLEERHGPWVRQLFDHAEMGAADAANSVEILVQQFDGLANDAPALRPEIVSRLSAMTSLRDAHDFVQGLEKEFKILGPASKYVSSVDALHAFAARLGATSVPQVVPGPEDVELLEIDHCISGEKGVQAARLFARADPNDPHLHVTAVPVNVKASSRAQRHLVLDVDAPHLAGRPAEWSRRLKGRHYELSEEKWYELDSGKYAASIVLENIPVTQQRLDGSPLSEIVLKFRGHDSGQRMKERDLHFEAPEFIELAIELPQEGDTISARRMREYPLGIQVHFSEILQTLHEGSSSFLVAAPRRFGKTTLLRALEEELRESDIWVIKPDAATPETSIREKFVEVCELLGEQLGAHVSTSWRDNALLPPGDVFDAARAAAAKQGKRAIYVFLDESQALFAQKRGKEAAERMKIRIDADWGVEKPGMVPVRFGLFGQLHLTRQLAGQLDGVFARNWRESEFQPDRIEKMLRGRTKDRMQSTRNARQLLSEAARNFHILRALLDEIRGIMIAKHRAWFLAADVAEAMEAQLDRAIRLRGPLVSFLLDPLNGSEDLSIWKPVPAYPVAIAWALVLSEENRVPAAQMDRARTILNEWVQHSSKRFTIPLQRVEDGLRSLRDLDVLDHDNAFRSRLLKRYFIKIGQSKTPLREPVEEQVLQSLTIDEVPIPEGLEEIGSGGQATVYRDQVEGRESAVRVMELAEREDRITFIETCHALKAIEGTRKRAPGYLSLPVIRQAGLTPGVSAKGVIIYDFVEGSDLTQSRSLLAEPAVVSIGSALAEALSVLEQRNVVHRDIRLENVVLRPDGIPVLIDFGLARLLGTSPVTPLQHRGVAPEASEGIWTSKADVFALSWCLQELLAHFDETTLLGKLLMEASNSDPQLRCSPVRLAEQLRALADQLNIESKRHVLEMDVGQRLREIEADLVQKIGGVHLQSVVATIAGFFPQIGVLQHVAHFLDDMFYECTRKHLTGLGTHLNLLPELDAVHQNEFVATGYLRHSLAHRNTQENNLEKAAHTLRVPARNAYEPLKNAVLITAQQLEQALAARGLHGFVSEWIRRCEVPIA